MMPIILCGAVTILLLYYLLTGKSQLLIYPGFEPLLWGTVVVLALFVLVSLVLRVKRPFSYWQLAFCIPIIVGFLLPPLPLSSSTAEKRGVALTLETPDAVPVFRFATNTERLDILGWLRALSLQYDVSRYIGKDVKVIGFVAPGPSEDTFLIARFVVSCCVADARPLGLPVKITGEIPARDTWLEVTGVMNEMITQTGKSLVIEPEQIVPIPTPANPYVYY